MTAQDLKNAILQMAVRGNLVEQCFEEGSAEDLFKEILQEKINGLCKKEPVIAEDEIPFDIPETWKWVRVNSIAVLYNGRAYSKEELKETGKYPVLRVGNLFTSHQWYYSDLELGEEKYCQAGDLLYAWSASFGPHIWNGDRVIYHYHIWKIVHSSHVFQKYLYYYLLADTERIKQSGHGLAMIHVTKAGTEQRLIPLPPIAEQQRIVARIEELMPLVEEYGKAEERLTELNADFPDKLRKSILQQAIQGKLTERDPADEPASELLKRIHAEKERLGKSKKEKPLPPITEEEIPFEIPDSWVWVRFSSIINYMSTGPFGSMLHKSDYVNNGIPLVNPTNIIGERIIPSERMMVSKETVERLSSYRLQKGTIVMGRRGEMGRCAVITDDEEGWLCGTGSFFMEPSSLICSDYMVKFFASVYAKHYLGGESVGSTMNNLNHNILSKMPVPLPPLAEQQRIVDRVNELLAMCDELK